MNRRQFIQRGALFVPATFGIFVPRLIRAQVQRPYPLTSSKRSGAAACSATTVDVLQRFEQGTNGTTPSVANLTDGTYGAANGTWTRPGAASAYKLDTSLDQSIPGLAISGGSGCGDATTKVIAQSLTTSVDDYPLFTFSSTKATLCIGFAFRVSTFSAQFDTYSMMRTDTGGGEFFSCAFEFNNNDLILFAHADADGAQITGLLDDTWYWVVMKRDATTSARLRVYSLPGLVQQGSESVATLPATNTLCSAVRCGLSDPSGATASGVNVYWDDIAMRFADIHPLLPTS